MAPEITPSSRLFSRGACGALDGATRFNGDQGKRKDGATALLPHSNRIKPKAPDVNSAQ
jgi:hypothetical protein